MKKNTQNVECANQSKKQRYNAAFQATAQYYQHNCTATEKNNSI